MIKRRVLSVTLCLCLVTGLLAGLLVLPATAERQWQTGTEGVGSYAAVTEGELSALGTNLIAGKLPAKSDGTAYTVTGGSYLTDGKFGVTGDNQYAELKGFYNQWASLRYDLGEPHEITALLTASPVRSDGGNAWQLRWVKAYVSDSADTLFDKANLVAQALKTEDAYKNILLQAESGVAYGRYVGFQFWVPSKGSAWTAYGSQKEPYEGTNLNWKNDGVTRIAKECYGGLEIGELAVYGQADDGWRQGTAGVGQYKAVTDTELADLGINRLAGKAPAKANGDAYTVKDGGLLTDGSFGTAGVDSFAQISGFQNQWASLRFDLGRTVTVESLLAASPRREDGNKAWQIRWVRAYVSESGDTLFDETNLVAQALKVGDSYMDLLLRPQDGAVTGRYVGFQFWVPSQGSGWAPYDPTKGPYEDTNLNWSDDGSARIAQNCWGALQLGELAVYGTPAAIAWNEGTKDVGTYAQVLPGDEILDKTSLILNRRPESGAAGTAFNPKKVKKLDTITDGKLTDGTDNGYGEISGYYNDIAQLTFDLGRTSKLDSFLVGSPVREDGNNAWQLRWVRIYVSDDKATLYEDGHLVARAEKLGDDYATIQLQPEGGVASGRYVGFQFWVPSKGSAWTAYDSEMDDYEGTNLNYKEGGSALLAKECYGAVMIGELGVYGEAVTTPKTETQTVVCVGDGITYGVHYDAADTALANPLQFTSPYPVLLEERLDAASDMVDYTVVNAGIVGASAVAAVGQESWLTQATAAGLVQKADALLIMLGTNDADGDWASRKDTFKQAYKDIIEAYKAQNANVKVYVLTSSYTENATYKTNLETEVVIQQKQLARELGVPCVDVYTASRLYVSKFGLGSYMDNADLALQVGLHPSVPGLGIVAGACAEALLAPPTAHRETVIGTAADVSAFLPAGQNLLKGEAVGGKEVDYLVPTMPSGSALDKGADLEQMTDGLYYGINTTDNNRGVYQDWQTRGMVYDLRGKANLEQLFVYAGASGEYHTATREWAIPYIDMYIGDDPTTLFTAGEKVATIRLDGAFGKLVDFGTPVKARYVGFYAPGDAQWGNIFIGELGLYGSYDGLVRPFEANLIAGQLPVEAYLSRPGDMYHSITAAGVKYGDGDATQFTDGDDKSMASVCLYENITVEGAATKQTEEFLLAADTPWQVFVYYLGGTTEVNTMSLSGISPYTAGVDFYVGQTLATLFDEANRVYTTDGDKTTKDAYGRDILDPAYDDNRKTHTYDRFDTNVAAPVGRYAAFVITRPYASTVKGWYYGRVSEMTVTGKVVAPEQPFDTALQTVSDKATGITVTLSRLNFDDVAFFENLGDLKVTVSDLPAGVEKNVHRNWLTVDSQVYTLELVDKTGRVLTADEVSTRYWQISFPHTVEHFQTLGLLADNKITRVRNAYTAGDGKTVLAGSDYDNEGKITGNSLRFVYLRYNSLEEINRLNGKADNIFGGVYQTKGIQQQATTPVYLWAVAGAVMLAVGATAVVIYRKRRRAAIH